MSNNKIRAREKLVISIHLTLYPEVDNNFIRFINITPRRSLAKRVCEAMNTYLAMGTAADAGKRSEEASHE